MPAEPNLTGKWRAIYGLIGLGIAAAGFLWLRGTIWGTLLPIAGAWMVLEALIGWTVMNAVLGLGGPRE